ncbi:hypothetical protein ABEW77_10905 [Heyndrickxia sporothermodurans]|uniref:hypothetical protein n=1 Tax=Heyndrickxia sporothermodurans TaxID=46224 RepID=UPI003D1BC708
MHHFKCGYNDGYLYGYLFFSGLINKLVLDSGPLEIPVKEAEILVNDNFVLYKNLSLDYLETENLYGSKARIKYDLSMSNNDYIEYKNVIEGLDVDIKIIKKE